MGINVKLTAADGHQFDAYCAQTDGALKGSLVVIQEIFGVNDHIQSVCDRYAAMGYTAIAPALFDRLQTNVKLNYDEAGMKAGLALKHGTTDDNALMDIAAAGAHVRPFGKVSVVGYCWGGTLAFLTACQLPNFFKAIGYYGGGIPANKDKRPQIPTLLHFGREDGSIPMTGVEEVIAAHPEMEIHVYEAGHGFNCDARASYNKVSADLALERSLNFLSES
jgi:carboxymethylenebutenolidase